MYPRLGTLGLTGLYHGVFTSVHRRSQGVGKGAIPPQIVILCCERHFSKQNSVIRLKSNILAPQIFGLATPLPVYFNVYAD